MPRNPCGSKKNRPHFSFLKSDQNICSTMSNLLRPNGFGLFRPVFEKWGEK